MFIKLINLFRLFPSSIQFNIFFTIFLLFICGFLEMIGVGLIIPILDVAMNNENSIFTNILRNFFPDKLDSENFINYLLLFFLVFFLLKNIILTIITFVQYKIFANVRFYISQEIFRKYVQIEYKYYEQNNSNEIIRNLTTLINNLNNSVIIPIAILLTESLVFLMIIILCLYINFTGSIMIFLTLIVPSSLLYILVKNKLKKYGEFFQKNDRLLQGRIPGARRSRSDQRQRFRRIEA